MRYPTMCVMLAAVSMGMAIRTLSAQGNPASVRAFEVASIKPNTEGGPSSVRALPNGTLVITNNTAWNIVRNAYGVSGAQLVGGPGWLQSERFDITAKAAAPFTQPEGMALLRALFAFLFA